MTTSFITKQLLSKSQSKISFDKVLEAIDDKGHDWETPTDQAAVETTKSGSGDNSLEERDRLDSSTRPGPLVPPELRSGSKVESGSNTDTPSGEPNQENSHKPEEQFILPPQLSAAFRYWIHQFQLHNPRQIKRLYNSYNLIWHYYGETEYRTTDHAYSYSRLLGLILLDYLNTLPSTKRKALKLFLKQEAAQDDVLKELGSEHWQRVREILSANPRWRQEVEPFVLPALDAVEQNGSNSESSSSEGRDTTTPND